MKIDKKSLDSLSSLPDDQLVGMLRLFGAGAGIELKNKSFSHDEVEKLRAALRSLTENDVSRAMEIFDRLKNG